MSYRTFLDGLGSGNAYRTGTYTGLMTGIAAGTANAGHIWVVRWAPGTSVLTDALIQRLRIRAWTISGFTGAQEVLLALYKLTGYTAAHSGQVALTFDVKKRSSMANAVMTGRIANTGALTAGTHTISTDSLAAASFAELAAGAAVPKGYIDISLTTEDLAMHPILLTANEGLLVRNEILMGAGGTVRMCVEMDWLEIERH